MGGEGQAETGAPELAVVRSEGLPRGPLYQKLRPGPGQSTDQVMANQRARLTGATVELVAERGYGGVTVRGLSCLAGVSTKTFYELFENVEDCFVATYAQIVQDLLNRATEGSVVGKGRLRARVRALFEAFDEDPKATRLVLVDGLSAGPVLNERTRTLGRAFDLFFAREIAAAVRSSPVQSGIVDGAVAAALHLARGRLSSARPAASRLVADEVVGWLLSLRGGSALGECDANAMWVAGGGRVAVHLSGTVDDRSFLLGAVLRLASRDGWASLTIPGICREAGVPRRIFDEHFSGPVDCLVSAIESRAREAFARAEVEAATVASWEQAVVRTVVVLCAECSRDPELARLSLVEIFGSGRLGLELWRRLVTRWARRLRQIMPPNVRPGLLAAEASVAAAIGMAAGFRADRLVRAVPSIAFVVLAPAIGTSAAERVIASELGALVGAREVIKHSDITLDYSPITARRSPRITCHP